jgi:hypothetical protein
MVRLPEMKPLSDTPAVESVNSSEVRLNVPGDVMAPAEVRVTTNESPSNTLLRF